MKKPKLVQESEHGLSMKTCKPEVVYARVISVYSKIRRDSKLMKDEDGEDLETTHDYDSTSEQEIKFLVEVDGEEFHAKEKFIAGDVIPKLGQWVRGIVVWNQWGSTRFVTTHLMKEPDEKSKKVR